MGFLKDVGRTGFARAMDDDRCLGLHIRVLFDRRIAIDLLVEHLPQARDLPRLQVFIGLLKFFNDFPLLCAEEKLGSFGRVEDMQKRRLGISGRREEHL